MSTVTTQAELDAALAAGEDTVYIQAPEGVWITLRDSGSSHVEARGSSHVVARGSSHVEAWDSSHVVARPLVAVHLHSVRASVEGGVVIDVSSIDQADPATWCDMQGIDVEDGHAVVYKAVNDRLESGYGCPYPIGETVKVTAKEWKANGACGNGLHFGPTPRHAQSYNRDATRFLACRIPVEHASGIPGGTAKIKARSCVVLHEVDIDGKPVGSGSDVAAVA